MNLLLSPKERETWRTNWRVGQGCPLLVKGGNAHDYTLWYRGRGKCTRHFLKKRKVRKGAITALKGEVKHFTDTKDIWMVIEGFYNPRDGSTLDQWFLTWVRSNPRGSLSHSQGFGRGQDTHSIARFTLAMSGRFYIYLCFEEIIFYFSNYEGFGECTDEACRVQYLQ